MPKVLIAPLDWGLGHATRCIPLIESFRLHGWEITIAADGHIALLLNKTFPDIPVLQLPGYRIRYAKSFIWMHIIQQIPRIRKMIGYENKWLKEQYDKGRWDVIISDNRPGFFHQDAYNIYITHQLNIKTGLGQWANWIATRMHRQHIRNFDIVWVPDRKDSVLSGTLSTSTVFPVPVNYIGPISRIRPESVKKSSYDILFMLSGPEPQRSLFEKKIFDQIKPTHGKIALVRGTTDALQKIVVPKNVDCIDLAGGTDISRLMNDARLVICRSGYSSLMDLARLSKKALLIPTSGQGEQKYLAERAEQQGFFPFMTQHDFDLDKALKKVSHFSFSSAFNTIDFDLHHQVIGALTKNHRAD